MAKSTEIGWIAYVLSFMLGQVGFVSRLGNGHKTPCAN